MSNRALEDIHKSFSYIILYILYNYFQYTDEEVAVGERIAYWVRTPQVPGSRPGWYGTFYWASDCWPPWQHQVERSLVCVEGRERISRAGLTQDIKMGSCVLQCDVQHSDRSTLCLYTAAWHFCVAAHWSKYLCYKQASSWYDIRCFKATLNPTKQIQYTCKKSRCSWMDSFLMNCSKCMSERAKAWHVCDAMASTSCGMRSNTLSIHFRSAACVLNSKEKVVSIVDT